MTLDDIINATLQGHGDFRRDLGFEAYFQARLKQWLRDVPTADLEAMVARRLEAAARVVEDRGVAGQPRRRA